MELAGSLQLIYGLTKLCMIVDNRKLGLDYQKKALNFKSL